MPCKERIKMVMKSKKYPAGKHLKTSIAHHFLEIMERAAEQSGKYNPLCASKSDFEEFILTDIECEPFTPVKFYVCVEEF